MNVLRTSNEHKGILITCPHCKLGSRYDGSYIEDAIKIRHDIVCVACGEVFNLVVSIPTSEAVEHTLAPDGFPPSHRDYPFCECSVCMGFVSRKPAAGKA